mgnify:CR=1 FL=1
MQQPGYGGPLPQEVAMGPPDVQGMTPQNVPQGKIEQMLYSPIRSSRTQLTIVQINEMKVWFE